jgi:hypothetical protein
MPRIFAHRKAKIHYSYLYHISHLAVKGNLLIMYWWTGNKVLDRYMLELGNSPIRKALAKRVRKRHEA